jgi:hypothetical protein
LRAAGAAAGDYCADKSGENEARRRHALFLNEFDQGPETSFWMNECNGGATAAWAWCFVEWCCAGSDHGCKCFGTVVYAVSNVVQAFTALFKRLGNW